MGRTQLGTNPDSQAWKNIALMGGKITPPFLQFCLGICRMELHRDFILRSETFLPTSIQMQTDILRFLFYIPFTSQVNEKCTGIYCYTHTYIHTNTHSECVHTCVYLHTYIHSAMYCTFSREEKKGCRRMCAQHYSALLSL